MRHLLKNSGVNASLKSSSQLGPKLSHDAAFKPDSLVLMQCIRNYD